MLALLLFAATRLIGLEQFPIYFFTDEAIQSTQAADLVQRGFRGPDGELLPTFFQNGTYYNLSVSVYAQVIPYLLFGFSEFATRATSALIALSGMIAVGLILKQIFKIRFWWMGVLLLSITPAWFLHTRTAFETVIAASLYAWFLYFYLRYRYVAPRNLYPALICGALVFYAYSPAQVVIVVTGLLLLLSDIRFHWQTLRHNPRVIVIGVAVLIVAVLPYIRFQAQHPTEPFLHLRTLDSYLTDINLTTGEKIERFWQTYAAAISPAYWYGTTDTYDLIRHILKGYGNILWPTLPFALIGLAIALRRWRSPAHRAILIALLVTPIGTALVGVQIYRELAFVIPAGLLTAIGLAAILSWLARRIHYNGLAIGAFVVLGTINVAMLQDALVNGPTWYNDYEMGGLQYGAREVFGAAEEYIRQHPQDVVLITPTWANGTDVVMRFFLNGEPRAQMANIDAYKVSKLDLNDRVLFIMTPEEYQRTIGDSHFADIRQVQPPLLYPDERAGFYFVKLAYSPQADAIFAAENAARHQPVAEDLTLDGQTIETLHSRFDVGTVKNLFDHDTFTLVRTEVDNPFFIEMTFPTPRRLTGLALTTGTLDYELTVRLYTDPNSAPQVYTHTYTNLGPDPTIDFNFDPPPSGPVEKLRIEVKDIRTSGDAKIHVREIVLR